MTNKVRVEFPLEEVLRRVPKRRERGQPHPTGAGPDVMVDTEIEEERKGLSVNQSTEERKGENESTCEEVSYHPRLRTLRLTNRVTHRVPCICWLRTSYDSVG